MHAIYAYSFSEKLIRGVLQIVVILYGMITLAK